MENGSGDDFSVLFTPAGVLIRGFAHESEMSPYEALTLAIVLPSWRDALAGFRPPALSSDYLDDHPDHPVVRDRLLAALGLPPAGDQEVLDRLLATAARTVPHGFLPYVPDEEDSPFEPMLELSSSNSMARPARHTTPARN